MRTKLSLITAGIILALLLSACGTSTVTPPVRSLTVNGSGTVSLTPDIAYIYVGVNTEDPDISQAVSQNNAQAQTLVDALKSMGIAAEDIQTSNFSVYSNSKTDPMTGQASSYIYMVNNTVYVTVRDLSKLGAVLNTAVSAGANNINSVTFDVADKTAAQAQARQKAMDNAASLAGELAQTAKLTLGDIQTISYSEYTPSPYYGIGGGGASAPNASVPIQPGQLQISVSVSVTYGIN
jgi:uncharacterized protein YggE